MKKSILAIIVLVIILAALLWLLPISPKTVPAPIPTADTNSITPSVLPRKSWVSPALTQDEQLLADLILNSNGFVDGKKNHGPYPDEGPSYEGISKDQIVFGDLNNDGRNEAVAPLRYCAASCGLGLYLFIFEQDKVIMSRVPATPLGGAGKDMKDIQIEDGILSVTETYDGETWWTEKFRMVNGELVKV